MSFIFFNHTGDIGVDVEAPSLGELFAAAAAALTAAITDLSRIEPRSAMTLSLESTAVDLLLVDWLSELLYRFDTTRFLSRSAETVVSEEGGGTVRLRAVLHGESLDPDRHSVSVLVKGVTYHELRVISVADRWKARVILDI